MKSLLLFLLAFISLEISAQYSSPESVEFDAPRNRYLVASTSGGGNLYSVVPGSAPVLFSSAVNNPYGICIVGDSVYVCDQSSYIKVFNLNTGAAAGSINTGGTFLNGICTDFAGNIYATDFSAKTIYRMSIATQQVNMYVPNTGTASPNGIVFDPFHNRLVVASWGANAAIRGVNMNDSTISTIKSTSFTNIDGITIDQDGNFYIAEWGGDKAYFFDSALLNPPLLVVSGLSNPADISYNQLRDTLAVPNTSANTVTFYGFPRPVAINDVDTVCVDSTKNICVLANDFAANNTPLILSDHTFPVNGTLNMQANCLQYQALTLGTETVTYTVCTDDTPQFCKTATLEIFNKTCAVQQVMPVADFTYSSSQFVEPCGQVLWPFQPIEVVNASQNADSVLWSVVLIDGSCPDSMFLFRMDTVSVTTSSPWNDCMPQYLSFCITAYNSLGSDTKCDTTCYINWFGNVYELPLSNISLFPNPANNVLTIDMQSNQEEITRNYSSIEIVNAIGQTVKTILRGNGNKTIQVNVSDLPEGVYMATIVSEKKQKRMLGKFTISR